MPSLKDIAKRVLRLPANALVASSDALTWRVEESLRQSDAVQEAVRSQVSGLEHDQKQFLHNANALLTDLAMRVAQLERTLQSFQEKGDGLTEFTREGTGPYPTYCAEANALGLDPNDYCEQNLGWGDIVPIVERIVTPRLRPDSVVCELGPGMGRWSRRMLPRIPRGALHLIDYSAWFVEFLADYFKEDPRVQVQQTDGFSLPLPDDSLDLIVSFATFVMMKAGTIQCYARDFQRVLKPGGEFAIEYLDMTTPEGWVWCQYNSKPENSTIFTYYTPEMIASLFQEAGLEILADERVAEWYPEYFYRMLIGRKPLSASDKDEAEEVV